ncbi:unnamed protein product, partial [Mesorhabditis spiculigera]
MSLSQEDPRDRQAFVAFHRLGHKGLLVSREAQGHVVNPAMMGAPAWMVWMVDPEKMPTIALVLIHRQQIGRLTPSVTLSSQEAPWIRKIKRVSKSALVTQQQKAEGVIRRSRSQARTPGQQQPDHSAVIVNQHKTTNSTKTQA